MSSRCLALFAALAGSFAVAPAVAADPVVEPVVDPVVDLIANRHRWHLHGPRDAAALIVPVAGEGLRKYVRDYKNPWGPVIEVDGRRGRVLTTRQTELHVPWTIADGGARVRIRVWGGTERQRVAVSFNGKHAGAAFVDREWRVLDFEVPAGRLRDGENRVLLSIDRASTIEGHKTYGLVHSIELEPTRAGAETVSKDAPWPAMSPTLDRVPNAAALTGFRAYSMYMQLPKVGALTFDARTGDAPARLTIAARPAGGTQTTLHTVDVAAGTSTPQKIDLAPLGGALVRLTIEIDGTDATAVAIDRPRITPPSATPRPRRAPYNNAILWVGDALRSDRLALYGPKSPVRTPRLDREAKTRGAVVYLNNQAASPSSPPSHASIQTGMIPRVHGVAGDKSKLSPGTPMLSTQLEAAGVAAAYYGNNPFGMARLRQPGNWTAFHQPGQEGQGHDCKVLVQLMLEYAQTQKKAGKRFFISALAYEPHTPYRYHEGITENYFSGPFDPAIGKAPTGTIFGPIVAGKMKMTDKRWAQLRGLYDGEIEYMDGCIGELLDGLDTMGARDETLFVLSSDHGEGFFEHGRLGHAFGHFAELGNVPFVLFGGPQLVDGVVKVDTVTSHLDITPTILDLMGVPIDDRVQGESVLPMALRGGPWVPRVMPLEYGRSYALRATEWKYIVDYDGTESVFDLADDPTEQKNLYGDEKWGIGSKRPIALRFFRDIAGFFLIHRSEWRMARMGSLDNHRPDFVTHVRRAAK